VVANRSGALLVPGYGEDDLVLIDNLHVTQAEPLPAATSS
jgi:hypothetical protein